MHTLRSVTYSSNYDFSQGKRGAVVAAPGNYQSLINDALRSFIAGREETVRA